MLLSQGSFSFFHSCFISKGEIKSPEIERVPKYLSESLAFLSVRRNEYTGCGRGPGWPIRHIRPGWRWVYDIEAFVFLSLSYFPFPFIPRSPPPLPCSHHTRPWPSFFLWVCLIGGSVWVLTPSQAEHSGPFRGTAPDFLPQESLGGWRPLLSAQDHEAALGVQGPVSRSAQYLGGAPSLVTVGSC